ncbi:hypothetical protein EVAR_16056_1 [Eumeta japonica]|uniref:Uncharacterized protein n=1 Tax=Eumeta variegata TaxID=151549 RepID=A0A4C1VXD3_EUMVA|nr:hypothetical protein EVAR_16056_1 [Eumeta japonica]
MLVEDGEERDSSLLNNINDFVKKRRMKSNVSKTKVIGNHCPNAAHTGESARCRGRGAVGNRARSLLGCCVQKAAVVIGQGVTFPEKMLAAAPPTSRPDTECDSAYVGTINSFSEPYT